MPVTNYISRAELKNYAGQISAANTTIDEIVDQVIEAASRGVEDYCGRRRFWKDTTATPRLFVAPCGSELEVDDIADWTDVTIKIDSSGDQTYSTVWEPTQFYLEPLNGEAWGLPATRIRPIRSLFPQQTGNIPPIIQVTAVWGWPAVPAPVKSATLMVALDLLKMKDAPFGVAGFGEYGAVKAHQNPQVAALLDEKYVKTTIGIA